MAKELFIQNLEEFLLEGDGKMKIISGNQTFHAARRNRRDEFYTRLTDIEKELKHYKEQNHFKNKVVFCNCDDPTQSDFWEYFMLNYDNLGIKKIISTHYQPSTLFEKSPSYKLEFDGDFVTNTLIKGDGDFRSDACVELLKQSDIVVTNPPFSLFRSYVSQLMEYNKKFLIIGDINAVSYKEIFPLIQNNIIWLGCTPERGQGDLTFRVPDDYTATSSRLKVDENGQKWMSQGTVLWFTNLFHKNKNDTLHLYKSYTPAEYPEYDNYDAIEVKPYKHIPKDYYGAMGVPLTFLSKYNPEQFEILNANDLRKHDNVPIKTHGLIKDKDGTINGKAKYVRLVIRRRR